jgi:hypothetical protein
VKCGALLSTDGKKTNSSDRFCDHEDVISKETTP